MTTSNYLKTQTDLMIALGLLRGLPLREFIAATRELRAQGAVLRDREGVVVMTDPERMGDLAERVEGLLAVASGAPARIEPRGAAVCEGRGGDRGRHVA